MAPTVTSPKSRRYRLLLWFVLVNATFAVPAFMSMHTGDDLGYMFADSVHHGGDGQRVITLAQCLETQAQHYLSTNGRFAVHVTVMALLNLVPLWVYRLLNALVFGCLWLLTVRIGTRGIPSSARCAVTWLLLWICLPQPGLVLLTLVAYAVNYLWVCTAVAAFLLALRRRKDPAWWIYPLAFVVGTLHEGFSLPLCAALTVTLAVQWSKFPKGRRWPLAAVLLCLILGTAVCVFAPGNMTHARQGGGLTVEALSAKASALGFDMLISPATWLLLFAIGWGTARDGIAYLRRNIFWLTAIAVSLAFAVLTFTSPRQLTFPFWCTIALALRTFITQGRAVTLTAPVLALAFITLITALRVPVYRRYCDMMHSAMSTDAYVYPHGEKNLQVEILPAPLQRALSPDPLYNRGLVTVGDRYTRRGLERLRPVPATIRALLPASPQVLSRGIPEGVPLRLYPLRQGAEMPAPPREQFVCDSTVYIITPAP